MRTLKKIRKAIVKKLKNWKGKLTPTASTSSSKDFLEETKKPSENILSVETSTEQQAPSPTIITETAINTRITTSEDENSVKDVTAIKNKDTTPVIDEVTTDTELYEDINENSEILNTGQPMCESREELQNASIDTTVQEPNAPDNPSTAEPSGNGNSADEKSSKKAIQPIIAGIVGAVLLASGVALCIMKMPVVAAVVGIVGLVCMSFALYDALKPNTKLERVESGDQPNVKSLSSPAITV